MDALARTTYSNDWITALFLLSLLLLVLAREFFGSRFTTFASLPFQNKYMVMFNKKSRLSSGFHWLLSTFQMLNLGLFFYLAARILRQRPQPEKLLDYGFIIGAMLVFYLIKMGLQFSAGYIFNIRKLLRSYIFNKWTYLNYSALAIFWLNLLLAYAAPDSKILVIFGFGLLITVNLIGWFTVLNSNLKYLTSHFFYFILYLCGLEIAPLVIVPYVLNA